MENVDSWSYMVTCNTDAYCKLHHIIRGAVFVDMGRKSVTVQTKIVMVIQKIRTATHILEEFKKQGVLKL